MGNDFFAKQIRTTPWQGRGTTVTSAATSQRRAAGSTSFTLVSDDEVSYNCYVKCVNHRCLISLANQISFRRDLACLIYVISVTLVVLFEPFITIPCDNEDSNQPTELKFKNVLFTYTPCMEYRYPHLLFLSRMDCQKARHLLVAVLLGSLIGYERRSSDRPAGIRTSKLFTY